MVRYRDDIDGLSAERLEGFFDGWPRPPSAGTLLRVLRAAHAVALAEDDGQIVGFVYAISDGVLAAYVPLLEVRRSHRGQGIGRALMVRLVDRLSDLYMVDLVCDAELEGFYRPIGFRALTGMALRQRAALPD